ncbi:jg9277 [Pararge aegeria aegeria]|uniref:Jg9277 protein n=1 Tax=Pararge aegeria aegeria TaxID=348720 RepID=A0A8S4SAS3_9NEOP|nr:jg9277 [Pararge aegeria aegeria]
MFASVKHPLLFIAERSKVTDCPPAEIVSRLHPIQKSAYPDITIANLSLTNIDGSGVVVRAEEALIVAFVLLLWVAAIALFFNRWGKIRMLEPYQPKFQQQHRQSCALAENSVSVPPHETVAYVLRSGFGNEFIKMTWEIKCMGYVACRFGD